MKAGPSRHLSPPRCGYGAVAFGLAFTLPWLVHDPFVEAAVMVEGLVLVRFVTLLRMTSQLEVAPDEMAAMSRAAAGAFLGGLVHAAVVAGTGQGAAGTNEVMSLAMAGMIGGALATWW